MPFRKISEDDQWITNDDGDVIGIRVHGRSEELSLENLVGSKIDPVTGRVKKLTVGVRDALADSGVLTDANSWPMRVPFVLSSPPTFAAGTANAASAISGSILHSILDGTKFTCLGGPMPRGVNFPNYGGVNLGVYPQITSTAPTAVEFNLDTADATGRFEISVKGSGGAYRILVKQNDGSWGAVTQFVTRTTPIDGNGYLDLVTMGAAGIYGIRIEFSGGIFYGIKTAATDTVSATKTKKRRYIVVGDSFTEPTFSDSGTTWAHNGWVPQLSYLTGYDIWCAGSGGTGYVNPGSGRVKFADRLANDILAFNPDGVIFAGGINDTASDINTFSTEVQNCIATVKATGKEVIVLSNFYPKGINGFPATILQYRDVIQAKCVSAGAIFLDMLNYGGIPSFLSDTPNFSTTLSAAYVSGNTIQVADIPAYFKGATPGLDHWFVKIGAGAAQYVREVTNISGTGPYTLSVAALGAGVALGAPVSLCGQSYQTGTGRLGATVGDGNSDRYTGTDNTHPTNLGHQNIARCVADLWSRSLAGR